MMPKDFFKVSNANNLFPVTYICLYLSIFSLQLILSTLNSSRIIFYKLDLSNLTTTSQFYKKDLYISRNNPASNNAV